jgi:hypothetical protein
MARERSCVTKEKNDIAAKQRSFVLKVGQYLLCCQRTRGFIAVNAADDDQGRPWLEASD